MPPSRLVIVDPGHFHAALLQKEMYADLSPLARVYAPLGADLADYLARIARFNRRAEAPTRWQLEIRAAPDFLDHMRREPADGVAVFSGRNGVKIERIAAALAAGLHVLADKPVIIRREDLPALAAAAETAAARRLVFAEMTTGREDVVARLTRSLRADPEVFGDPDRGSPDAPGTELSSVHYLLKTVAGAPNLRPAWYFDTAEQGEGLADTAVHLVDRAHETLFPGEALDCRHDIDLLAASRWPTRVSLAQFRQVTGETGWPDALLPQLRDGALDYYCNGRVDYRVRGIYVRLEARWEWQAETGGDRHAARYRGSRGDLEIRQSAAEGYRPELYVVPREDIAGALRRRLAALQPAYPGVALERQDGAWRVVIPAALRVGHEAHFAQCARNFLARVAAPETVPPREQANFIARYFVTTGAVALSRGRTGESAR